MKGYGYRVVEVPLKPLKYRDQVPQPDVLRIVRELKPGERIVSVYPVVNIGMSFHLEALIEVEMFEGESCPLL